MPIVTQCCGLAGVGELLVDLGIATGESGYFDQADSMLALMLTRCGGDLERPVFPDNTMSGTSALWAVGSAGVLSFLRRLRDRSGERILLADWRPPGHPVTAASPPVPASHAAAGPVLIMER
jgi:hypothetical protein